MEPKKIAIIGTGISGLTCGYYLTKSNHQVTLYEKEDYIGGHTNTIESEYQGERARVDTGFIVFNDRTYPHFMALLKEIGVDYQPTEMSFSVRNDALDLEYNGSTINALFAQRANLFRPRFLKMVKDIMHFNRDVKNVVKGDTSLTIGAYLENSGYSSFFKENYLLPMISAIWSMGTESCMDFPLGFFVRFFDNHGLLDISNRPQWYTVKGGSSSYIDPLTSNFNKQIRVATPVKSVERKPEGVLVHTDESSQAYDQVIFACHGDQSLALLENPTADEQQILGKFSFSQNRVVLHTDTSHMPTRKKAWASWNYRITDHARDLSTLTYNMNILQRLKTRHTYLVTLNQEINPRHVIREFNYRHPVYTTSMIYAQTQWQQISGKDRIHYCGAYWFNGFHEDGVRSGLRICKMLEAV